MNEIVIQTRALRKVFKGKREVVAVDNIDLDIKRGEIFGLLGPNGAGKRTLSMLVTIQRPTSGTASVAGIDVRERPGDVRKNVGIVFQEPSLDTLLTARENLMLHGRLYGVPPETLKKRTNEMLALVQLTDRADDLVKKYSGGMKRRLEIARGLMHAPAVLFLDEPTLGLDPATRERIWGHIRELRTKSGTTIVLTTHYMDEADSLCDRIAIIDHGKIVAMDTPQTLKASLGGDTVILLAPNADIETLRALPFVKKVEKSEGKLLLTVENGAQNLAKIIGLAGEVLSVEVRQPRLEDVFIALTGRGLREEKGEDYFDQYMSMQARGQG
jgi:ABC-2 type transport system ATP-binding protein